MSKTKDINEFEKLLFEIVEDLKTIHLGFINNKHHKVEIYPKILKLLDIFDVPEYYNLENAKTLQSLYLTCNVVFLSISNFPESPNYSFYCENNKYIIFIHRFTVFLNIHKLYREVNKRIIAADFNILDLINEINVFNNKKEVKSLFRKQTDKTIQFKDIFKPPYNSEQKITDFKKILQTRGYTDKNNVWAGLTTNKNELATLYFVFDLKGNIFKNHSKRATIRTLYKEFGINVNDNELRNLTREMSNTETREQFETIFKEW